MFESILFMTAHKEYCREDVVLYTMNEKSSTRVSARSTIIGLKLKLLKNEQLIKIDCEIMQALYHAGAVPI